MERYRVGIASVAGIAGTCLLGACSSCSLGTQLGDRGHLLGCSSRFGVLVGCLLPRGECFALVFELCALLLSRVCVGHVGLAIASDSSAVHLDLGHEFRVCPLSQSELAREEIVVVDDTAWSRLAGAGSVGCVALQATGPGVLGAVAQPSDYRQNFSVVLLESGVDLGRLM